MEADECDLWGEIAPIETGFFGALGLQITWKIAEPAVKSADR
jgi:hypothetical protein